MSQSNKNILLWISLFTNVLFIIIIISLIYNSKPKETENYVLNGNIDYKNTTFVSDLYGTTTLKDGKSIHKDAKLGESATVEIAIIPGAKLNIISDIDGDGVKDNLFLVSQNGGGSGTFVSLVAQLAISNKGKYINAYPIGDRISPQSISINKDGNIEVAYLARVDNEPMSTEPTLLKRIILRFNKASYSFERTDAPKGEMSIY